MDDHQIQMMRLAAQGFSCSQILILLALEARGEENPALVRSMAGLAYGCGSGRGTCGVLTGGCCLLALYAGKGSNIETESEDLLLMVNELSDWFESGPGVQYGAVTCEAITGEDGPAAARERCGRLVADTWTKTMEILVAHGIDPYAAD